MTSNEAVEGDGITYGPEERDRLWQHVLHEDTLWLDRLDRFFVVQGFLFAAAAISKSENLRIFLAIAGVGISLISIPWLYKQWINIEVLIEICKDQLPEFADTCVTINARKPHWLGKTKISKLLSFAIPSIAIVAWILTFQSMPNSNHIKADISLTAPPTATSTP